MSDIESGNIAPDVQQEVLDLENLILEQVYLRSLQEFSQPSTPLPPPSIPSPAESLAAHDDIELVVSNRGGYQLIGEEKDDEIEPNSMMPQGSSPSQDVLLQSIIKFFAQQSPSNQGDEFESLRKTDSSNVFHEVHELDIHREEDLEKNNSFVLDYSSIENSCFILLGGGHCEYFITLQILVYLEIKDIGKLASTSKFFRNACSADIIWNKLYRENFPIDFLDKGFSSESDEGKSDNEDFPTLRSILSLGKFLATKREKEKVQEKRVQIYSKHDFHSRLKDHAFQMKKAERDLLQHKDARKRSKYLRILEGILDLIHVRTMLPTFSSGCFLSIVLFCQYIDGLNIPLWSTAIPLAWSLLYVMIGFITTHYLHARQFSYTNILHGLYQPLSGIIPIIYRDMLGRSVAAYRLCQTLLFLMISQIALVVLKLSCHSITHSFSWGLVFIPIWLLFTVFLILPCCTPISLSLGAYFVVLVLGWIPFFILFVCLTYKLDHDMHMRLALILIPFYLLEGIALVGAVIFLVSGIVLYRRGFLERLDEYYIMFSMTWITLTPIVSFQALLSARDDNQIEHHQSNSNKPSATEVAVPILIVIGCITIAFTLASFFTTTQYQLNRERNRVGDELGTRVLYPI